jgi:hypothetical protein
MPFSTRRQLKQPGLKEFLPMSRLINADDQSELDCESGTPADSRLLADAHGLNHPPTRKNLEANQHTRFPYHLVEEYHGRAIRTLLAGLGETAHEWCARPACAAIRQRFCFYGLRRSILIKDIRESVQ